MAKTVTIYGIPNCDTMKKARAWLDQHKVAHVFHDYKKAGIDKATLDGWVKRAGWEVVLNRAGTTFRALDDADKANLTAAKAVKLMLAQPGMIKRPVLIAGDEMLVGFKPDQYAALFG
ncbi:MAG: ArsC family reductase [Micropepsaceae bacterium]